MSEHRYCAVLLCAGFGTRLGPTGRDRAKPLLPVAGRPLLDYLLDQLLVLDDLTGIRLAVNGRFRQQFEDWARSRSPRCAEAGRELTVRSNGRTTAKASLGSVADLWRSIRELPRCDGYLIAGGDSLFLFALEPAWQEFLATASHRVLALREQDPDELRASATLQLDHADRVVAVEEKPDSPVSGWLCPALYMFRPSAVDHLCHYLESGGPADALGRFVEYLARREHIDAHRISGRRLHVTTEACRQEAERMLHGLRSSPSRDRTPPSVLYTLPGVSPGRFERS